MKKAMIWKKTLAACCCLTLTLQANVLQAFAETPEGVDFGKAVLTVTSGDSGKEDTGVLTVSPGDSASRDTDKNAVSAGDLKDKKAAVPALAQPKIRFDMESLKDGMVTDCVSGTAYAVNGEAVLTQGCQGQNALAFNGSDTYINLGTAFQPQNAYTMMGWVKQAPDPADGQAVFYRGNSGKVPNQLGMMVKNEQVYHAVAVGESNSDFQEMFSPAGVTTGQWHHIAVARDGADVRIYIDGEQTFTKTINQLDFADTSYPMYIGIDCDSSGTPYGRHAFQGEMDDLRLYDVAVTAEDIAAIYGEQKSKGAPAAENLSVSNLSVSMLGEDPRVKGMLEAVYTFKDEDGDAEGDTRFQWQMSDTPEGPFENISGICTRTIILLDKYEGKYLRCRITPQNESGTRGEAVFTPVTAASVQPTDGNPLTDWFYEAEFGIAHHFLSNYFNLPGTYADDSEKWDREAMTWDEFVGQFDAREYARQVNETGAKYVLLTLGQNSGSYCAPNEVYDKYMREAGLLKEGEQNPKTTSMENDMPMKIAKALKPYGIRLMLYLPSNPPHSACWDETGTPNGYGYFSDYLVTTKVFDYTPGQDGVPSQKARKVLSEMVEWWSQHYGDLVSGWWFDGFYHSGAGSQTDMSLEYNVSTLANAAKAGNPYSIVTFNKGLNNPYAKITDYTDYTSGESQTLFPSASDTRWVMGDCQLFHFVPLGSSGTWQGRWGCKGCSRSVEDMYHARTAALANNFVLCYDLKVNVRGELDPASFDQLKQVNRQLDKTPPTAPSGLTAQQAEGNKISLEWQASIEEDGVMKGYNIYRDGKFLAFTQDTGYVDGDTRENMVYTYTVRGVNTANLISEASNEATVTAGRDMEAPRVLNGFLSSRTTVTLVFNELVTEESAQRAENYTIAGVPVTGAELGEDGKTVMLTIAPVSPDDVFFLHVSGVADTAELGNTCENISVRLSLRTHYYKFDDVSGQAIKDYDGKTDGEKFGTVESGPGKNAGAAKVSGSDGVKISSDGFEGTEAFTISAWFMSQVRDTSNAQTLFSGVTSGTLGSNGLWVYIDKNTNKPSIYTETKNASPTLTGSTAVLNNVWQHLAVTYDGSALTLYLNGANIGSQDITGLDAGRWKKELLLGANTNGSGYLHGFKGLLDEYKFYSAALTEEEIALQAAAEDFKPVIYQDVFTFDKQAETLSPVAVKMDYNGYKVSGISCGSELNSGSYTVEWDGILLPADYLSRLENGVHTFQVMLTKAGTDADGARTETVAFKVNVTGAALPETDKSGLQAIYEEGIKIRQGSYTDISWAVFRKALAEAKNVLDRDDASQKEVDDAFNTLVKAKDNLTRQADKKSLKELIDHSENLTEEQYTPETWEPFHKALEEADRILKDGNAAQQEVDDAYRSLSDAMGNLVKKETGSPDDDNGQEDQDPSADDGQDNASDPAGEEGNPEVISPKTGDTASLLMPLAMLLTGSIWIMGSRRIKKREQKD